MAEASLMALLEAMLSLAARPALVRSTTATPNIKPGGYPDDIFLELSEEEMDKYRCSICYFILKDVMECRNKHRFCFPCIHLWSTTGQYSNRIRCPVCRCDGYYSKNPDLDNKITLNRVKCPFKGCNWKGLLKYSDTHKHSNYQTPSSTTTNLPPINATQRASGSRISNQSISNTTSRLTSDPNNNNISLEREETDNRRSSTRNALLSPDTNHSNDNAGSISPLSLLSPLAPLSTLAPVPPRTPRPSITIRRRVPTLPSPLNPIPPSVAPASTSVAPASTSVATRSTVATAGTGLLVRRRASQNQAPARLSEPVPTSNSNTTEGNLTTVRDTLVESRNRLEGLMSNFDNTDRYVQEAYTFQEEREDNRRHQLQEVQELGRRLGQVAAELRQLLNHRRVRNPDSDDDI